MTPLSPIDRVVPRHLEEETLVAFLDGELQSEERTGVANHLEQCWECRSRLTGVEATIEAFLRARRGLLPETLPPSASAIAQFRARLATHAEHLVSRSRLQRHVVSLGQRLLTLLVPSGSWRAHPAIGLVALVVVTTVGLIGWWTTTPLSASDVLARADAREWRDVRMADAVVTTLVEIEKVDSRAQHAHPIGTFETARDYASSAISVTARRARGELLQEVFPYEEQVAARRYFRAELGEAFSAYAVSRQWMPSVSVTGYLRLIGDRGHEGASARRAGRNLIEVEHPFGPRHPSGIRETRLLLDAQSYAPAQISIVVVENGSALEYRFRRLNLRLVPRSPGWAARFASVSPATPRDRATSTVPDVFDPKPVRRPLPLSYADSMATTEEVEAVVALHAAGADLGEEVHVFPMSDGSLLVQGLVETHERKAALEQALARVTGRLRVELYAPVDLSTGTELFDSPYGFFAPPPTAVSKATVRVVDFSGVKIPLHDQLRNYFDRVRGGNAPAPAEEIQRDMTRFVTEVLGRSERALFHAWALRKLDVQFSPRRVTQLSATSLEQVNRIRDEHRRAVADASRELSRQLAAVVPDAMASTAPARGDVSDLDGATVLRLTSQQRDLVRELFMPSVNVPDVGTTVARLVTLCRRLG